ncbi:hypothetical protein [Lentzea cavernae]|uniref:Uncharacterized protein n=1 Tax=Lentzea cavernae TaxID=2020703 RepID=A0ABQ3MU29_9PSEU|nr:hypothetical protein [Lentzea cavernae]GHH57854.1 hypothetical protein GCM10017774_78250 [Lentzea cavernae]
MNAYAKLPALLRRIDALESGEQLCRTRDCYSRLWLLSEGPVCGFCAYRVRALLMADIRLSMTLAPHTRGLSPFVHISAC